MSQEEKDKILHALTIITDEIIDISTYPSKQKVELIIKDLYEVMRILSAMSEK